MHSYTDDSHDIAGFSDFYRATWYVLYLNRTWVAWCLFDRFLVVDYDHLSTSGYLWLVVSLEIFQDALSFMDIILYRSLLLCYFVHIYQY